MLPFCRLPEDAAALVGKIRDYGFKKTKVGMMVELPSNVFLAREFSEIVDFFFVGPRDLTQAIYGADRSISSLGKYDIGSAAPKEAVMTLFRNMTGRKKEVFIALFDLYKHIGGYNKVKSNNIIYYSGSPSGILKDFGLIQELSQEK